MATLSTHVLDSSTGLPAQGLHITLKSEPGGSSVASTVLATAHTNADGRVKDWGMGELAPGIYLLRFGTGDWFAGQGRACFYPEVLITFAVDDDESHYHVPLLLAPYAYSTYRGS
jgi:5-hydroxyisourate hydrolase